MSTPSNERVSSGGWLLLAGFVVVVLGVGTASGLLANPGGWYQTLDKPDFTPPNWLFGPVWTTLYIFIAIAGWRTWRREPVSTAMTLWIAQMLLNWAWTPVWFGLHLTWVALVIILALLAMIVGFIAVTWRSDRISALLFVPYALWVGFASMLNFSIAVLN